MLTLIQGKGQQGQWWFWLTGTVFFAGNWERGKCGVARQLLEFSYDAVGRPQSLFLAPYKYTSGSHGNISATFDSCDVEAQLCARRRREQIS